VTRHPSPRLAGYGALCAIGLVAALASRRPELVALAAPFALVLALAGMARPPRLRADVSFDRERMLEDDELHASLLLKAELGVERVEAALVLPRGFDPVGDRPLPVSLRLLPDATERIEVTLQCDRWGSYLLGDLHVRASDALGLFSWELEVLQPHLVRVYPKPLTLRHLVTPRDTQAAVGSEVARAKAEGLEFADLRPFVAGDRVRSVNWRASARRGELIVNERHPDRNADIVIFLDTFVEARRRDESTIDRAVRAAATLAAHYLARRDRVGLVALGGTLRWLEPAAGVVQGYRVVDALLETEVVFTYAWKDVTVLPPQTLPPHALVVAVTPLLDPRGIAALLDLAARGHDLTVIEVSPLGLVDPGPTMDDQLAYRLWRLRRAELQTRFARLGVAVGHWEGDELLSLVEEVRAFRRHARVGRR
jgi:uncharacterized protein (DUF58 family)